MHVPSIIANNIYKTIINTKPLPVFRLQLVSVWLHILTPPIN